MNLFDLHHNDLTFIAQWSVTIRTILEESSQWRKQMKGYASKMQQCIEIFFESKQFIVMANFSKILHLSIGSSEDCSNEKSLIQLLISICNDLCEEVPEETLEILHLLLNFVAKSWTLDEFNQVFDERLLDSLKRCIKNVFGNCKKQLITCTCLAIIQEHSLVPNIKIPIGVLIIPCLLSIVEGDKSYGEVALAQRAKASITLAYVVAQNEDYQKIAEENRAIFKIQQMLIETRDSKSELSLLCAENALIALATLSSYREDVRASIFSHLKLVRMIVEFLNSPSDSVKSAACACIRSLSRSPKGLRTCLSEFNLVDALTMVF